MPGPLVPGPLVPGPVESLPALSAMRSLLPKSFSSLGLAAYSPVKSHPGSAVPVSCTVDVWVRVARASDKKSDRE